MIEQVFIERRGEDGKPTVVFRAGSDVLPRVGDTVALPDIVYVVLQVLFDYREPVHEEIIHRGNNWMVLQRVHIKVQAT